ncbi:MAG: 5-formyltetrahydrofolate cyclo-ligase [Gammaproteobacteria bacterium]|nr:5-formyltetrahydrofolate cyclo-ligase [Gammaproteobacteria bacterium]
MENIAASVAQQRTELRKQLRQRRNSLSPQQQRTASLALSEALISLTNPNDRVALYLANDGEISPNLAIEKLIQQNRQCLLPVMHSFRKGYLNFQSYDQNTAMIKNQFGILEPRLNAAQTIPLQEIDYIFMPLVGFDNQGNRMGMGGGFYDRTLAQVHQLSSPPRLVGLAHDCQHVEALPVASWDIPIQLILTPTKKITPVG